MNKYYTPELEELHAGQIYEWRHKTSDSWIELKDRTHEDVINSLQNYFNCDYRIRYLDEEDILSLGWVKENTFYVLDKGEFVFTLNVEWGSVLSIYTQDFDNTFFIGFIKNRYELKQLHKFLGL